MNATEFMSALTTHATEQRLLSDKLRKQAAETRTNAQAYAAQHVGDAMGPARERIAQDAESKAQTLEIQAARAARRSAEASAGRYLCGQTEWRDSMFMTNAQHAALLQAATQFGVVVSEDDPITGPTNRRFG
jgi:hypothetical protein